MGSLKDSAEESTNLELLEKCSLYEAGLWVVSERLPFKTEIHFLTGKPLLENFELSIRETPAIIKCEKLIIALAAGKIKAWGIPIKSGELSLIRPDLWENDVSWRHSTLLPETEHAIRSIQVDVEDLLRQFPANKLQAQYEKETRGRKAKLDWELIYALIIKQLHEVGFPPTQEELIQTTLDILQNDKRIKIIPDAATLREKISAIYKESGR